LAELLSYTIPNLIQGISQQPDAQRDPSQGEVQINGMSSVAEGLRKRDSSHTLARVSSSPFGDCFIHSILRDQSEEYLAVIAPGTIRVFDLLGNEKQLRAPKGYAYLSNVTAAKEQIRAVSIADYTFVLNTTTPPAMQPLLAPATARPSTYEALVWVKAANYSQTYTVNVNGNQVEVETAVAPVVVSGTTSVEHRISSESVAETIKLSLEGRLTGVDTITPQTPITFPCTVPSLLQLNTGNVLRGPLQGVVQSATLPGPVRAQDGTYQNLPVLTNGLGYGGTVSVDVKGQKVTLVTMQQPGNDYKVGDTISINAQAISNDARDSPNLQVGTVGQIATARGTSVPTTTSGSGRGMTLDIVVNGSGLITSCVINKPGIGYAKGDLIYVLPSEFIPGSSQLRVQVGNVFQTADEGPWGTVISGVQTYSNTGTGCTVDLLLQNGEIVNVTRAKSGNGYAVDDELKVNPKDLDPTNASNSQIVVALVKTVLPLTGGISGVTVRRSGSVLWLQSASPMSISATDARANADITAILGEVQAFTELPTIAPKGYQVTITGDPGTKFDGYYVEFKPREGDFGEGSWVETVAPGCEYRIDPLTMPWLLVRLADGTFLFHPADGSTQAGLTLPRWGDRVAGDYDTAPDPSFIGYPINDIAVYKNRLVMLADENVILSRTREFFEFFPETVTTVLDTDPIDVVASNNRVSVLRYAVPYQDELILFSGQYQFRFNAADTVLSPATAQITVLTQYEVDVRVRPQQAGGAIFFCQANGQWSQLREFSVRGAGTALTADAQDLTSYTSAYIPAGLYKMTVNDTGNAMFVISDKQGFTDRIYVYKWFFRNTGQGSERAQSSWSYWDFNGADKVLQVLCIRENLYCLMQYGDEVFLEVIPVMDRMSEVVGTPYPLLLDRRISTTVATQAEMRVEKGTYDAAKNTTTWLLPYQIRAKTQAWSSYSAGPATYNGGVLLGEARDGYTITARGDWSQADVFFGEPFTFRYRFTRFKVMRDIGGGKAAANAMRTQVRHAKLRYHETGFFKVFVMPEHRSSGIYTFDGTLAASRNARIGQVNGTYEADTSRFFEGVFTIPVMSRGERCMVELHNDTPHPCKFSTCEWVGLVSTQSRALQ
jgi:hypothetical protein